MAAVDIQKGGIPTLHHLNHSQSQRVLWLLEELEIEYKVELRERDLKYRAPPEMKNVHQLGKAPILVTADGRPIVETSAIIAYLLRTYDTEGKFAAEDWVVDEELTSFAGASLGPLVTVELLFDIGAKRTPWPLVYLPRAMKKQIDSAFITKEFKADMDYLESMLGDKEWFNGKQLGRSDIMLSWPFDMIFQRGWMDLKAYPKIEAWRTRVHSRDAWKRGLEKGNGFDLTIW